MDIYFPSCNFTKASPETAKKLRAYLSERMPVAGCCRFDKKIYAPEDSALYFCQACRETLESKINCKSLWPYLLSDESFPWPDYSGLAMGIQDCWRDRNHPEIHEAVRGILRRMNVKILEIDENREKSVFCADLHFEAKNENNIRLMEKYKGKEIYDMPDEVIDSLMQEQVKKFRGAGIDKIVTNCNRCTAGINRGGGDAVHLLNLIFN